MRLTVVGATLPVFQDAGLDDELDLHWPSVRERVDGIVVVQNHPVGGDTGNLVVFDVAAEVLMGVAVVIADRPRNLVALQRIEKMSC